MNAILATVAPWSNMSVSTPQVNILMYHSISEGKGPTCIAPAIFRDQLAALEECDYRVVSLATLAAWLRGQAELPPRSVVLTFDDGFEDFAASAFPELRRRGWTATVFLPSAKVGAKADWDAHAAGRWLMSWATIADLAQRGIDFGAHSVHHVDLTTLSPEAARAEIVNSKCIIAERTGQPVCSFAAPFGRTNAALRAEIRGHYTVAVGTRLAQVGRADDLYDLPRIEMCYFRNVRRWRAFLAGRARAHFFLRRTLRRARALLSIG